MKHILLTILLLCCEQKAFCYAESQVGKYYQYVYIAEKNVLDKDYDRAILNYHKAFNSGVHPFLADIRNDLVVGIILKNNPEILSMSRRLILKGFDTNYFHGSIFTLFRKSSEWQALKKAYPKLKKESEQTIDKNLLLQIEAMVAADQKWTSNYHKNEDNPLVCKEYFRLEDSLYMEFKSLMINNNYLCEEKMGIRNTDSFFNSQPYWVILTHSFQKTDSSTLFNSLTMAIHKAA